MVVNAAAGGIDEVFDCDVDEKAGRNSPDRENRRVWQSLQFSGKDYLTVVPL